MFKKSKIVLLFLLFVPQSIMAVKKEKQEIMPEYEAVFRDHFNKQDYTALIEDFLKYPELRERIEDYLLCEKDYHLMPLSQLTKLAEKAKVDERLGKGFSAILAEKQGMLLNKLSDLSFPDLGAYYKKCEVGEHDFLKPIFEQLFVERIDDYRYMDVKLLATSFQDTDLGMDLMQAYQKKRDASMSLLKNNLGEYTSFEDQIGKDFRQRAQAECAYLVDSLHSLIFNQMKKDYKKSYIDISKHEDALQNKIRSIVIENINSYLHCVGEGRVTFRNTLFDENATVAVGVGTVNVSSFRGFRVPMSEYNDYCKQLSEPKKDDAHDQLVEDAILTFTPVGLLSAIADFADSITPDKYKKKPKAEPKEKNYGQIFSNALYKNMTTAVNNYLESYFNNADQTVKQSQQSFTRTIYENM